MKVIKIRFITFLLGGLLFLLFPYRICFAESPVITLADPTIFYHEDTYYLYGTGYNIKTAEGFLVYTSTDLQNWNGPVGLQDGYALKKGDAFGEAGFWAPQVFFYNDKFYMAYTADESIAIAVSDSPLGPFKQQVKTRLSNKAIDPFVFIDDDGKRYLYYVNLGNGNEIYVAELENDLSGIRSGTTKKCISSDLGTWERSSLTVRVTEGPTVVKQGGTYFLIYSANHYEDPNYAVGYATSTSPTGSWSKYTGNPVLKRQDTRINGPGHGDLFKDANGSWQYVFHTHNSNEEIRPRKTALADAGFNNGQFTINGSGFSYLKNTVYFKQDFNSSTDTSAYIGKGTNQFDSFFIVGNEDVNITNGKLRIVKNGNTGTNRVGINKTATPFNPGGINGFLKFEMEVTVSNNITNVADGFRFSIGIFSATSAAAPVESNVHSDLYINPVAEPGKFILQGKKGSSVISSPILSGTQNLIWYINNSGNTAGYRAPDGTLSSVKDDTFDVWVKDKTGAATLVLNDVPATTPGVAGLRTLKISNINNFVSTLDMDDILISEEPVLPVLPVSLSSFMGVNFENQVKLNWNTISEQNNARFEILRSTDGKNFKTIGTVQGNGTSNQKHTYSYIDKFPVAGANYYRLRQVDYNGNTTEHTEIVFVRLSKKSNEFKIYVTEKQLDFSVYTDNRTIGDLMISDMQGRKLYNKEVNLEKGYNTISIADIKLPDGILTGNLMIEGKHYSVKFIK